MKLKAVNALANTGCLCSALITLQSVCIVAERPEMWAVSLVLTAAFGTLTYQLFRLAQRTDRKLHMTRLQMMQAVQAAKKEMPARNCNYGQAKVAN